MAIRAYQIFVKMNKVAADAHFLSSNVVSSATSRIQFFSAPFSDKGEASSTSSAEAKYLHSLLEAKTLEGSGSLESINSCEKGQY